MDKTGYTQPARCFLDKIGYNRCFYVQEVSGNVPLRLDQTAHERGQKRAIPTIFNIDVRLKTLPPSTRN